MASNQGFPEPESNIEAYVGWLAVVLAASLPLYRPWVSLATTVMLFMWLFGGGIGIRARRLRGHRLTTAVLVFLGLNLSSLLWTSDFVDGLKYLTKYRYLLIIPIVASSVRPFYRRYAVTAFEVATSASVVLAIGVLTGIVRIPDAHPGNPSPTMAHLDFGLLLALAALLILARVLYSEMDLRRRLLWVCLAVLTIFGLAINVGLAGHLAFAGGAVVLVVHWAWGRSLRLVAGVSSGLALVLVVAWLSMPQLRARVDGAYSEVITAVVDQQYESNIGGRVAAMRVAREVFRDHPLLGTGVGGNIPALREVVDTRFESLKPAIYWYPHYHNQYAQVATELGTAGLLALAWIFWELIRGPRRRRESDAAALMLATVFLLGFLGEPYFHKQITLVMFALFAGLISAEQLDESATAIDES